MERHDPTLVRRLLPESSKSRSKAVLTCILLLSALCAIGLVACKRQRKIEIISRTVINGSVNNAPFKGSINATINVGRGGHSSCTYDQLPPNFTPGTIGTHA